MDQSRNNNQKSVEGDKRASNPSLNYLSPDGKIDWERAIHENEGWMRSTIALRVGERGAVDEVFQEVALAAAAQKAPLRDVSKVCAWLYRIAVIQSALYRRKAGRKRKLLKRYGTEVAPIKAQTDQTEPLDWLLKKERESFVRRALDDLPDDARQMLLMKYRDDMSYREIAGALKITELAVQSKLHRARGRLRRSIIRISNGEIKY